MLKYLLLIVSGFITILAGEPYHIYVSPIGNDQWTGEIKDHKPGSKEGPFSSLARARKKVQQLKNNSLIKDHNIIINVAEGEYFFNRSLFLGEESSGTEANPIHYIAQGNVLLSGGSQVNNFKLVTDLEILDRLAASTHGKVYCADLTDLGITDYGTIKSTGFGLRNKLSHMQVFIDGKKMHLARWPNEGWLKVADVGNKEAKVDESGKVRGIATDRFTYDHQRPNTWAESDDIWMHGYWSEEWADQYLKIKNIQKDKQQIVIAAPQSKYAYKKGKRYHFLNILEELDRPGEYYIDRLNGLLYVYPYQDIKNSKVYVSILNKSLIHFNNASNIIFDGFTIAHTRDTGVFIQNGTNVHIKNCVVENIGNSGVFIRGGLNHQVLNTQVKEIGGGGISIISGDLKTLTPSNHLIKNCKIHHFGQWFRTYKVGIYLQGVGSTVNHNLIHHAPHTGILYGGNDHLIEYNEIHNVGDDADDVGAIYTGREWAARGTVIRYNYIHDIGGGHARHGSNAIYLDDLASGQIIHGNVINNVQRGILLGGGRDNQIINNFFLNCAKEALHLDARGKGWSGKLIMKAQGSWDMFGRLEKTAYQSKIYQDKYPNLSVMLEQDPLAPIGNVIKNNVFTCSTWRRFINQKKEEWFSFQDNIVEANSDLITIKDNKLIIKSPLNNIKDLPFSEMGLEQ
ncbi:right-handed parallel beta-helix repeat-containing protein [Lentisphaera profundi]|uniref:Right-handed parallel beta-helix repeat-containing protein n=1 Tax=Lentisphaera profundi TaxID=1658616 RepID=A0ABY7VXY9_9BACT|nr:right-handed parallel beta-helix repeat-containing protein [Lentisphaera profundi]WDE98587.1 right-handed parallel beta-helix repeat-containing protein [Lentisphaera profundi]